MRWTRQNQPSPVAYSSIRRVLTTVIGHSRVYFVSFPCFFAFLFFSIQVLVF
ncbi:hypothetical protein Hanom_Chr03g00181541 [Helianthus anomalus]